MASALDFLLANGAQFLPNIQESAVKYVFQKFVMASRVRVATDLAGDWNARKISEYMPSRRAQELDEDTAIPDTQLLRAKLNEVSPRETGDRYRITERRAGTDPEPIIRDSVEALSYAVGSQVELDLMNAGRSAFRKSIGTLASDLSMTTLNKLAVRFRQQRGVDGSALYHVLHPYQIEPIMEKLLTFTDAIGGAAALENATSGAVTAFNLPVIGNIALAPLLPRKVVIGLKIYGTGGTFRLQVGNGYVVGENITGAITVTGTHATDATAIQTALNALDMSGYYSGVGTWVVTSASMTNITITPPSDLFLSDPDQVRAAVKYDEDLHVDGGSFDTNHQKSGYDAITTLTGAPEDELGNELGFTVHEKSDVAEGLSFFRDALIYDVRKAPRAFSEVTMQGRTFEYSLSHTYAAAGWRSYLGSRVLSTASNDTFS
jgi:hypothetical protein